jgi:MoaA/NifB/PqqE/SkfB family radical SAM enzyme
MADNQKNSLQIETTSRCTLKCPACSRTWWNEVLGKKIPINDIDIDLVYNFLDCKKGKEIGMLDLRGDWGDCIYYPKLFDFINKFREEKKFTICTNGSRQTQKFWDKLSAHLTKGDIVEFSIDGLKDTNHLYRRNSDWESLMIALNTIYKSKAQIVWKSRIFSFNQDRLDEIKTFAEQFDARVEFETTHRFGDDSLKPRSTSIDKELVYDSNRNVENIIPRCRILENSSISAYNMFVPCGWFCAPQVLYKSDLWKNRERWMIKDTTLDVLIRDVLTPWADNIEKNPCNASILCQTKCRASIKDRRVN